MNTLLNPGKLLDEHGNLQECGFAFDLVKDYRRVDIKAPNNRIKEWDYYYVGNDKYGIALTVADNSYIGIARISFIDLVNKKEITKSYSQLFTKGKIFLPSSSKAGDITYQRKKFSMEFLHTNEGRKLICSMKNFDGDNDFYCCVDLYETNNGTMTIAIPFEKSQHFYYNQKINCQIAQGFFNIGLDKYIFDSKDSRGVLDWGRGVWTYKNTYYWASASGKDENGNEVGFNLGYGFGDTSFASENMFFYKNRAYKLDDVDFGLTTDAENNDQFLSEWHFTSNDNQIDMTFTPILNRHSDTNLWLIRSNQNQVFGVFNGYIMFDKEKIEIKNLTGFAEKVYNKW